MKTQNINDNSGENPKQCDKILYTESSSPCKNIVHPFPDIFIKAILDETDDGIIVLSHDNIIYFCNNATENIFGIKKEDLYGKKIDLIINNNGNKENKDVLKILKNCQHNEQVEYTYQRDKNSQIDLMLTIIPVFNPENNSRLGTAIVARNITLQKIAEQRLRDSEAFYHSLVETLPQNILRKDLNGRFTFGNRRFCQDLGVEQDEIIGKTDYDFYPPELAKKYQEDDKHVIQTGKTVEIIEENQPPGGSKMYVQVFKTPIRDKDGNIIGIQGIYWDITEQKVASDKLVQANEELEKNKKQLLQALSELEKSHEDLKAAQNLLIQAEKLESVGRLAAGVAHEVKNPLAIIQSGIDYLRQTDIVKDQTISAVLSDMREALVRADSVVRGMLDFAGSQEIGLKREDINTIIEKSLALIRHDFNRKNIQIKNELAKDIPPVLADASRIEQVLINLFINALQAMPNGGTITVRTYTKVIKPEEAMSGLEVWGLRLFEPNETIVVAEVDDTGTGIPQEILPRLFEPFTTSKKSSKGTGLGLAVSKKIMEMQGGTIEILNRTEGGVRARLILRTTKE